MEVTTLQHNIECLLGVKFGEEYEHYRLGMQRESKTITCDLIEKSINKCVCACASMCVFSEEGGTEEVCKRYLTDLFWVSMVLVIEFPYLGRT